MSVYASHLPERQRANLKRVRLRLAEVDQELAELGDVQGAAEHVEAMRLFRERFEVRFASLARARDAATELRRLSSASELLHQAPHALTAATGFRLAIVSAIQDSVVTPLAVSVKRAGAAGHADAASAERLCTQLREHPLRLSNQTVESEVVRRRRATIVSNVELNARVDPTFARLAGWHSYVVAPLLSGESVIGMIHADRGSDERVDVLDRDVLGEFTGVVSQLVESGELRRALRRQREALRQFTDRVGSLSASLADAPISFSAYVGEDAVRPEIRSPQPTPHARTPIGDDRLVLSGLLTRRELDVMRLLAEGSTNQAIADALVLSGTTVKFHVNSILRKLRVANRAEAVARYLSLLGMSASH